jgi:putative membrane protein
VVSFETAGGGDTEARLRFVSVTEAKRLQRALGRLKREGGEREDAAETEPDAGRGDDGDERVDAEDPAAPASARFDAPTVTELFSLDRRELALVGVFSIDVRVPGILFLLVSTVGSTVVPAYLASIPGVALVVTAALVLVGVALVSWIVGAAAAIVEYYDFRLVRSGEELQYERGLLQRYDGSIPFDKIQTLTIADNPLKRRFGYATLYIETAGYAPGSSGGSRGSEAAVPIAEREHVLELVETLEPVGDVDLERPPKRARERYLVRYLLVVGALLAALVAARSLLSLSVPWWPPLLLVPVAIAYAHAAWLNRGHWLGDHHVVTRNGVLRRETKIVPYYRIQTIIDSRTVFQRRRDLATVTIDTAGSLSLGGQDAAAVDVAGARADELREGLEARLDRAVEAYRAGRAGVGVRDRYDSKAPDSTTDETVADESAADETAAAEDSGTGDREAGDGSATDPHDS